MKNLLFIHISVVLLLMIMTINVHGQCYSDRHATNISDAWLSCTETISPNPANGQGHWIQYDLGASYNLYNLHIWNMNHPDFVNSGFKEMKVEYSLNGTNWSTLGTYNLPKAFASGFYEGYRGINFAGVQARYVLLSGISNFNGGCFGLSEIKIYTTPQPLNDWRFDITECESRQLIQRLSFGQNLSGSYQGPAVTDNGDDTFDFDAEAVGPGTYSINYTYLQAGVQTTITGKIQILSCESRFCADCSPCDNFNQLAIDSDPIPALTYYADSLRSIGAVRSPMDVTFRGEDIVELNPGFTVDDPVDFLAEIRDCQTNVIQNHSFENEIAPWTISFNNPQGGTASRVNTYQYEADHCLEVNINEAGSGEWMVRLRHAGITLQDDEEYEFIFAIRGDERKEINFRIFDDNGNTPVFENIEIDPYWNQYRFILSTVGIVPGSSSIEFQLGTTEGLLYLDHVRLRLVE